MMNSTASRVPLITGLPTRISGSTMMRSSHCMLASLRGPSLQRWSSSLKLDDQGQDHRTAAGLGVEILADRVADLLGQEAPLGRVGAVAVDLLGQGDAHHVFGLLDQRLRV